MIKNFCIKKEFFVACREQNIRDHYEFKELIERGGYGVVYKAKMKCYPYSVRAIKRVKKNSFRNSADLFKEFQILTSLDHPHIIKIYETFEDAQNFFLVLDYCEGGQIFKKLSKVIRFSESEARQIFSQMVNIIKYCHANNVAHRDLKPQNFLFVSNKSSDLMLIDFGLSFKWKKDMRAEMARKEGSKSKVGTAYYMAPQIFKGDYDERCDIWSLGIILFMLVTGEPPVSGSNQDQILCKIREGKLNFHVLNQKQLSPEVVNLILKMLVKEQDRISLKDIVVHPWMNMKVPYKKLSINFQKIKNYSKLSKFKVLVLNYIASQLPQKEIMVLGKVFMEIDKNKDGYLTIEELSEYFKAHNDTPHYEDLQQIISSLDVDHNGKLAYNELLSACLSKSASNNRDYLRFAFDYFDLNHDGKVSREQLGTVLRTYKSEFAQNVELIERLMKECDLNGDGKIDFQQFKRYITEGGESIE